MVAAIGRSMHSIKVSSICIFIGYSTTRAWPLQLWILNISGFSLKYVDPFDAFNMGSKTRRLVKLDPWLVLIEQVELQWLETQHMIHEDAWMSSLDLEEVLLPCTNPFLPRNSCVNSFSGLWPWFLQLLILHIYLPSHAYCWTIHTAFWLFYNGHYP